MDDLTSPLDSLSQFGTPRIPSVPPGLGFSAHGHPPRTATPSRPPPGLVNPQVLPAASAVPITTPAPVTPLKPALAPSATPTAESSRASKKLSAALAGSEAKKNIKAFAVESGLSKEITSQAKGSAKSKKTVLQDEDFPALESAKPVSRTSTPVPVKAPSVKTPMVIKKAQAETPKPATTPAAAETPAEVPTTGKSRKAEKKPMPVLNIAAATKAAKKSNPPSAVTSAVEKPDDVAFPALPTPSSVSVSSPAARAASKTLRVISTPKTETAPSIPAPPALRHALSGLNRPETPVSENVSDSASIISASVSASRTNSPPPNSRVGSAAVRTTTKSQQRKARKDATKKEAAAIATTTTQPEPEVEIAPILGRKKKQKKEKPVPSKAATAAAESRPTSPGPADERPAEKDGKPTLEKASTYRQAVNESISLIEPIIPRSRRKDGQSSTQGEPSKQVLDRPIPSPAAVLNELAKSGLISEPESLAVLKAISSTSHRSDQNPTAVPKDDPADLKTIITREDQQALRAGKPVRKVVDGTHFMFTPNGNCVRNLSPAEEERYLQLQADLAVHFDNAATYVHPCHEASNGFSVIRGRAVANGTPPYFPCGPPLNSPDAGLPLPVVDDPVQKMTREEALANINQTILTRFNLGTMNLSSVVEEHNLSNPTDASAASSPHVDNASKNAIKVLEPFFSNFAAATQGHSLEMTAGGAESPFSGLAQTMPPPPALPSAPSSAGKTVKGGALAGITGMSIEDMEQAFAMARKEAEKVEKNLNQIIKKNRRMLSLSSSGGGGH